MTKLISLFALVFVVSLSVFSQAPLDAAAQKDSSGVTILRKNWFARSSRSGVGLPTANRPLYSVDEEAQPPADLFEKGKVFDSKTKTYVTSVPAKSAPQQHPEQQQKRQLPTIIPGSMVYGYEAKIRNDSRKIIEEISWEYIFIDPVTKQEVARREFTNAETIRPGKEKNLVQRSLLPPAPTVSASASVPGNIQDQYLTEVRIKSLKYSDGSVWQN